MSNSATSTHAATTPTDVLSKKKNVAAIVGGAAGGGGGAIIVGVVVFVVFLYRRRRHRRHTIRHTIVSTSGATSYSSGAATENVTPFQEELEQKQPEMRPYDPDDPTTFPPAVAYDMRGAAGATTDSLELSRAYTGVAEL